MRDTVIDHRGPDATRTQVVHVVLQQETSWHPVLRRAALEARTRGARIRIHHLLDSSITGLCHDIFPGLPDAWFDEQRAHLGKALERARFDELSVEIVEVVDVPCCHLDHVLEVAREADLAAVVVAGSRDTSWFARIRGFFNGAMAPALSRELPSEQIVVVDPADQLLFVA